MARSFLFISLFFAIVALSLVMGLNKGFLVGLYNSYRPSLLASGGESCLDDLQKTGAKFKSLGDQGSAKCPIKNAVKVFRFHDTKLSSSATLSCPTALNVANWLGQIEAKQITHMGTLNCRTMRGRGLLSEHSFGTAIDISRIDGASVSQHWNDDGILGKKLRDAAKVACANFSNVLTPETNRLHHDHFHLDDGLGTTCDVK